MEPLWSRLIETPLGKLRAIASTKGLCALKFEIPRRNSILRKRLGKYFTDSQWETIEHPNLRATQRWLEAYFGGEAQTPPPIDLRGTPFEKQVWRALLKIPFGKTQSYSQVAAKVGRTKAQRAVGTACRKNPISLVIPCHRVVGEDGKLHGYGGGLDKKSWLLSHEQGLLDRTERPLKIRKVRTGYVHANQFA